jgi:hypothetical protein
MHDCRDSGQDQGRIQALFQTDTWKFRLPLRRISRLDTALLVWRPLWTTGFPSPPNTYKTSQQVSVYS